MKKMPAYISRRLNLDDLESSRRLLCLIDEMGTVSYAVAVERVGLTPGTCNLHFQRLEHEGLICRSTTERQQKGRPAVLWSINQAANYCVTLAFDVPCLHASLADFGGKVVLQQTVDLSEIRKRNEVEACVHTFMRECLAMVKRGRGQLRQVFAACPGLLHPETGAVMKAVNLPVLDGLDVGRLIGETYGVPCFTGSLGLGFFYGETERFPPDVIAMVIHWDLGINAVIGRRNQVVSFQVSERRGHPLISEMGHIRIKRGGTLCHCGRKGCLEAYAGGWALIEQLNSPTVRTPDAFMRQVGEGDPKATAILKAALRLLGQHLAWPLQALGVEQIVVSGPMAAVFERGKVSFCQGLATLFEPDEIERMNPVASPDHQRGIQRGAFLLARRLFFHPEDYAALPQTPARLNKGLSGN